MNGISQYNDTNLVFVMLHTTYRNDSKTLNNYPAFQRNFTICNYSVIEAVEVTLEWRWRDTFALAKFVPVEDVRYELRGSLDLLRLGQGQYLDFSF